MLSDNKITNQTPSQKTTRPVVGLNPAGVTNAVTKAVAAITRKNLCQKQTTVFSAVIVSLE